MPEFNDIFGVKYYTFKTLNNVEFQIAFTEDEMRKNEFEISLINVYGKEYSTFDNQVRISIQQACENFISKFPKSKFTFKTYTENPKAEIKLAKFIRWVTFFKDDVKIEKIDATEIDNELYMKVDIVHI